MYLKVSGNAGSPDREGFVPQGWESLLCLQTSVLLLFAPRRRSHFTVNLAPREYIHGAGKVRSHWSSLFFVDGSFLEPGLWNPPSLQFHCYFLVISYLDLPSAGSGSKELTLGAALIDFQGSVHGHSSLSRHPSGIYYPS